MARRLFNMDKNGEIVSVRSFYAKIAGRDATKPRLRKKALKLIEISENTWRESILMRDLLNDPQHTFEDYNKQRQKIEKLRNVFFTRRSFSGGLKEAHAAAVDFAYYIRANS